MPEDRAMAMRQLGGLGQDDPDERLEQEKHAWKPDSAQRGPNERPIGSHREDDPDEREGEVPYREPPTGATE